jgi:hypothetical protein
MTARFRRLGARGFALEVGAPLPPVLGSLPALTERVGAHGLLAARVEGLRARVSELEAEVVEKEAEKKAKTEEAVAAGKSPPKMMLASGAETKLGNVRTELAALETVLGRSADNLLGAAMPHVAEALEVATAAQESALTKAANRLESLEAELEEAERLSAERVWLHVAARGTRSMAPFAAVTGRDQTIRRLRQSLRDSFEEFLRRRSGHEAEAEKQRAWERDQAAKLERDQERMEEERRSRSVRTEGMRVTHRGGVPVGGATEFQEAEPER